MATKIFIVDDALFMRKQLKKIIEQNLDFTVIGEAENGKDALEKLQSLHPDIVTLDMTMPEMDGITFLAELEDIPHNFKVIVVSALAHEARLIHTLKLGASDFIRKPYDIKNIIAVLKKYSNS